MHNLLCPVYLFWRALTPLAADLKLTATLFGPFYDDTWSQPLDRRLAAYDYPTFRWQPGEVVLSRVDIPAELGTPPGDYRLRLGVYDDVTDEPLVTLDAAGAAQGRWVWLQPIVANSLVTDGSGGPPLRQRAGPGCAGDHAARHQRRSDRGCSRRRDRHRCLVAGHRVPHGTLQIADRGNGSIRLERCTSRIAAALQDGLPHQPVASGRCWCVASWTSFAIRRRSRATGLLRLGLSGT